MSKFDKIIGYKIDEIKGKVVFVLATTNGTPNLPNSLLLIAEVNAELEKGTHLLCSLSVATQKASLAMLV